MTNQTPNVQQNPQNKYDQSSGGNKPTVESANTADQPTPVSASTQRQGNTPVTSSASTYQSGSGYSSQSSQSSQTSQTSQTSAQQAGSSAASDVKQGAKEMAGDAKRAMNDAAQEVKEQANEIRHQAQDQANSFLSEQKDMAAQRVGGMADALRQAGHQLAEQDEGMLAHYTDSLAGQLDNFSNTLRDREIGSLLDDAREMAHRQPELFVVGALAAGFLLGRFFKSSRRAMVGYSSYDQMGYSDRYGDPYSYSNRYGRGSSSGRSYGSYGSEYGDAGYYDEGFSGPDYYGGDYYGGNYYGSGYAGRGNAGENDPRNPARNYGEPYGQRYGEQFNRDRGPYARSDYENRSGSGYSGSSSGSYNSARGYGSSDPNIADRAATSEWDRESGSRNRVGMGEGANRTSGEVTTHGLGSGQSLQHREDIREGQEFGKGEEQISNYKGNETKPASEAANKSGRSDDREEGQLR